MDTLAYDIEQISIAVYSLAGEARGGGDKVLAINLEELSKSLNKKVTEVRQLEAENARLREALKPFAIAASLLLIEPGLRTLPIEAEYLRAARAALEQVKSNSTRK